jgi:hypothetical protein
MLDVGQKEVSVKVFCEKYGVENLYKASAQFDTPVRDLAKQIPLSSRKGTIRGYRRISGILIQSALTIDDSAKLLKKLRERT